MAQILNWLTCSSDELMCHRYSLRISRRHPASSISSSPGSSLDRAVSAETHVSFQHKNYERFFILKKTPKQNKTKSIIFRCSNVSFTICTLIEVFFFFLSFFKTVALCKFQNCWCITFDSYQWFNGEKREGEKKKSLALPFRSCNRVLDSWLSLHIWFMGVSEIFSSQQMKDGHAAKPWSKEFRKQVFPKFNRPGTIPKKEKLFHFTSTTNAMIINSVPFCHTRPYLFFSSFFQ